MGASLRTVVVRIPSVFKNMGGRYGLTVRLSPPVRSSIGGGNPGSPLLSVAYVGRRGAPWSPPSRIETIGIGRRTRRGWDSNPRATFRQLRDFRSLSFSQLRHLSIVMSLS